MKDIEKQVNRLVHAHKKQLKNLLRAKEHAKTPEAVQLHDVAVKSFLEVGKCVLRLEEAVKATQEQIRIADRKMHAFMREI